MGGYGWCCSFEERFLDVAQEALISTMQDNRSISACSTVNGKLLAALYYRSQY